MYEYGKDPKHVYVKPPFWNKKVRGFVRGVSEHSFDTRHPYKLIVQLETGEFLSVPIACISLEYDEQLPTVSELETFLNGAPLTSAMSSGILDGKVLCKFLTTKERYGIPYAIVAPWCSIRGNVAYAVRVTDVKLSGIFYDKIEVTVPVEQVLYNGDPVYVAGRHEDYSILINSAKPLVDCVEFVPTLALSE